MTDGRERFTSPTTLRLATPRAIQQVLAIVGISWLAEPASGRDEISRLPVSKGLYAWVVSQDGMDPMDCGGIYAGIGDGEGGLRGRLLREHQDATATAYHGHGIAVRRTGAMVVAGTVEWVSEPELDWLDRKAEGLRAWSWQPRDWNEAWDVTIERRLTERLDPIVPVSEAIAIRASVYLGDVGFPVNSKMAGAWGAAYGTKDKGWEDGAAWAAVTHLLGSAESIPGEEDETDSEAPVVVDGPRSPPREG